MNKDKEDVQRPYHVALIEGWLSGQYAPAKFFVINDDVLMSSQDIVLALAEMVDLEVNQVAEAMHMLGYKVATYQGFTGWALRPLSQWSLMP